MATVSEVELEQKTVEYVTYLREFFATVSKDSYKTAKMFVYISEEGRLTLEYKGRH